MASGCTFSHEGRTGGFGARKVYVISSQFSQGFVARLLISIAVHLFFGGPLCKNEMLFGATFCDIYGIRKTPIML